MAQDTTPVLASDLMHDAAADLLAAAREATEKGNLAKADELVDESRDLKELATFWENDWRAPEAPELVIQAVKGSAERESPTPRASRKPGP
jgi:hypothetical protein